MVRGRRHFWLWLTVAVLLMAGIAGVWSKVRKAREDCNGPRKLDQLLSYT